MEMQKCAISGTLHRVSALDTLTVDRHRDLLLGRRRVWVCVGG